MQIRDATIEGFSKEVKQNSSKIILYGAGAIGKVTSPAFISEQGLTNHIAFIADADKYKQGQHIMIGDRAVEICPPDAISSVTKPMVLLITGSRFHNICTFLNQLPCLDDVDVYILPQMLVKASRTFEKKEIIRISNHPIIPKTIHYCWFGGGRMPDQMVRYLDSWREFCPDYEIKEWNEDNYNIDRFLYTKQAYAHGKWAFVSDVARLDILYHHGGIYMDTDVELLRSLDDLLFQPGFCGVEKWRVINTGGCCGAVPNHPVIAHMLEERQVYPFENEDGSLNLESSGSYESIPLLKRGFKPNNQIQVINGMTIYSSDFFHPFDYMSKEMSITDNTYGIHHFIGSWI